MLFFSIIIPVYNKAEYLERCLSSIANQSYRNWEVMLVDDGSTDGSSEICDRWASLDRRFRVIHQVNCGVSAARNRAFGALQGEYVCFCDSDDSFDRLYLEKMSDSITAFNKPDLIITGYEKIWPNGARVTVEPEILGVVERHDFFGKLLQQQRHSGIYGPVWNKCIKWDLLAKQKIKFRPYTLLEDYDFMLDVYKYCETIVHTDNAGYHYYQDNKNSTALASFRVPYEDVIEIRIKAFNLVKEICGRVPDEGAEVLTEDVNALYLGKLVDERNPTRKNILAFHKRVESMLPPEINLILIGSTINSKIIATLASLKLWLILAQYLSFVRYMRVIFHRNTAQSNILL